MRYQVRSITGYPITPNGALSTTYWVADTDNCCREVPLMKWHLGKAISTGRGPGRLLPASGGKLTSSRAFAQSNADRLNAEHEAWLASA